jgi:hypothetical protein
LPGLFCTAAFFSTAAEFGFTSAVWFGTPPVANASLGLFAIAARMKSIHIGSAARAPVSFSPSDCRLS